MIKKSVQHTHQIKKVGVRNKGTITGNIGSKQGKLSRKPNIAAMLVKMVMGKKLMFGGKGKISSSGRRPFKSIAYAG